MCVCVSVCLCMQVGVKKLVVYLNKVDQVDDPEMMELVEVEMREILDYYKYDAENTPIISGSALNALEVCWLAIHFFPVLPLK